MVAVWEWLLLGTLVALSAFFSGSETALTSINKLRVRNQAAKGIPRAIVIDKLLQNPNRMLSTILVGNNLVNISTTALATSLALRLFGAPGVGITIAALTVILLIFGEITPKTYAATNSEKIAFFVARPIYWIETLFSPVVKALSAIAAFLIRLLGGKMPADGIFVTEEEIRTLVDLGEGQGALEPVERQMIVSVFDLNDILVREVMLPRIDMVAVPLDTTLQGAWSILVETGHSRIPVYQGNTDDIIGIFYAKDLMPLCKDLDHGTVRDIMREPFFVPETKRVSELLKEMRQVRTHIAVVLDEFGGTAGLAFLEDLVETVVGEIGDEFDKARALYENVAPGEIRASARVSVDDINDLLNVDLPQEEYDTLGGLVFHLFGRVPTENESIQFDDLTITVEEVEHNRIHKLRIKKHQL